MYVTTVDVVCDCGWPAGMLVQNYRSHSRLLELPSRLYYNNQLLASADPQLVTAPMWDELQKHGRCAEHDCVEGCCFIW